MKCIVVSCITLVFFERPSAITWRSDLAPLGFFLIAMTRSKSVKRFYCVDLNEEMTKQYMPDQLLTRRNKPIICFFSRVLLVSRFFFCVYCLFWLWDSIYFCCPSFSITEAASQLLRFDYVKFKLSQSASLISL